MGILRRFIIAVAVAGIAIPLVSLSSADAQKRLALVVGINDYPNLRTDKNPTNGQLAKAVADAETMAATLGALGFDVEIGRNLTRAGFLTALERVKRKTAPGDTIFIFFAGHGVALRGSNLLLPSDIMPVDPESEQLVRGLSVAETDVIDAMREKGAGLIVLALDACRDNPIEEFAREQARVQGRAFRSVATMRSVGLDSRPTSGIFSIYSAGIGQKALDGLTSDSSERNSVFTRVFAKKLQEAGRHLSDIMEDVKEEVARLAASETDPSTRQPHRQFPAFYNETQGGRIFLGGQQTVSAAANAAPLAAQAPPVPRGDPCSAAEAHWQSANAIGSRAALEDHLARFPNCVFAGLARMKLDTLGRVSAVTPAVEPPTARTTTPMPPAPPTLALETRARAFLEGYITHSNAREADYLAFLQKAFDADVLYYNKRASRQSIVEEQRRFVARWPVRSYRIKPETVQIECVAAQSACKVSGDLDYRNENPTTSQVNSGIWHYEFRLVLSGPEPRIVEESGRTVQRTLGTR